MSVFNDFHVKKIKKGSEILEMNCQGNKTNPTPSPPKGDTKAQIPFIDKPSR